MTHALTEIYRNGGRFDFFRAVMLCEEWLRDSGVREDPLRSGRIRFTADPSLAFAPGDIAAVEQHEREIRFHLHFMGLFGVSSPLPHFFSEYIAQHPEQAGALTDFLSIFNNRLYALFYRAWRQAHPVHDDTAGLSHPLTALLHALCARGSSPDTRAQRMREGLFIVGAQRTAAGLRRLVSLALGQRVPVRVREFSLRWINVKGVAALGRGSILGTNALAGRRVLDRGSAVTIVLGPVDTAQYESLLPGGGDHRRMCTLIDEYCGPALQYDIEIHIDAARLRSAVPGKQSGALGRTLVLGTPPVPSNADGGVVYRYVTAA